MQRVMMIRRRRMKILRKTSLKRIIRYPFGSEELIVRRTFMRKRAQNERKKWKKKKLEDTKWIWSEPSETNLNKSETNLNKSEAYLTQFEFTLNKSKTNLQNLNFIWTKLKLICKSWIWPEIDEAKLTKVEFGLTIGELFWRKLNLVWPLVNLVWKNCTSFKLTPATRGFPSSIFHPIFIRFRFSALEFSSSHPISTSNVHQFVERYSDH